MHSPEPEFYFALPRLIQAWRGGSAARTETNWGETNFVGGFVHAIVCLGAYRLLLAGLPPLAQWLLVIPLIFLVWVFWPLFFYLTSLLIPVLQNIRLMPRLIRARAQSIMVGIVTTCFALALLRSGTWMRWIGFIWLAAMGLNLCAAALLAFNRTDAAGA